MYFIVTKFQILLINNYIQHHTHSDSKKGTIEECINEVYKNLDANKELKSLKINDEMEKILKCTIKKNMALYIEHLNPEHEETGSVSNFIFLFVIFTIMIIFIYLNYK